MKRIKAFVLGIGVALAGLAAANYRVIITSEKIIVAKKGDFSLAGTLVDTRSWGPADWLSNPGIVADLVAHGLGELTGKKSDVPGNAKELLDRVKAQTGDAMQKGVDRVQEALPKQ
jgi:hypothetical protein